MFDYYWGQYNSNQVHESQKQQWYRLAIETGIVMDYMGPTIEDVILLTANLSKILEKVNRAANLERPVSLSALRGDLGIILKQARMSRAKAYQPANSGRIFASR